MRRFEAKQPDFALASLGASRRRLDAVVDGVADQMHQRIAQLVDHSLVEFGLFAVDFQADLLLQFLSGVTHHAFEAVEKRCDGNHPRFQHAALQAVGDSRQLVDRFGHLQEAAASLLPRLRLFVHGGQLGLEFAKLLTPANGGGVVVFFAVGLHRLQRAADRLPCRPSSTGKPRSLVGGA